MTDSSTYERPNTISGLQAKRRELGQLRKHLLDEAKKVLGDIDHIDACIKLFDPKADIERLRMKRYEIKHRAHKGQQKRFVLSQFRTAKGPLTSRQITKAWMKDRGLDEDTFTLIRTRIGACLVKSKNDGLLEVVGQDGDYKLWQLKKGDQ